MLRLASDGTLLIAQSEAFIADIDSTALSSNAATLSRVTHITKTQRRSYTLSDNVQSTSTLCPTLVCAPCERTFDVDERDAFVEHLTNVHSCADDERTRTAAVFDGKKLLYASPVVNGVFSTTFLVNRAFLQALTWQRFCYAHKSLTPVDFESHRTRRSAVHCIRTEGRSIALTVSCERWRTT